MKRIGLRYVLSFGILGCMLTGVRGEGFTIQVGAFSDPAKANEQVEAINRLGLGVAQTLAEKSGNKGTLWKVVVGDFGNRQEAESLLGELKKQQINGYIRTVDSVDVEIIARAIENGQGDIFSTGTLVSDDYENPPLPAGFSTIRAQALNGETTSPETLAAIIDYIDLIPDNHAGKAKEILMLGNRSLSGKDSFLGNYTRSSLGPVKALLFKVANGDVAVNPKDQVRARAMLARIMHYYDRTQLEALRAYRQVLADQKAVGDLPEALKTRSEISALIFEMAKQSGYDKSNLLTHVRTLWDDSLADLEKVEGGHPNVDMARSSTVKVGLMLTEIMLLLRDWEAAIALSTTLEEFFGEYTKCRLLLVESFCHRIEAAIHLDNQAVSEYASLKGLEWIQRHGDVLWADPEMDVTFKIHVWRLGVMQKFRYSEEEQLEWRNICIEKFGHNQKQLEWFKDE